MKYCIDKYPKGSFSGQISDGRYIDEYLYENLSIPAKRIVDDLTFLGVCYSSTMEVGTGKSSFMQQIGECWTELINKYHNVNLKFDLNNIVFKPRDLIEKSFQLPKYSCIILDEWEDEHYFSELGTALRTFFRKCRQLNLFIIIIIPNFFQLPVGYAVSRSLFAIDVHFQDDFQRGYFKFYNFDKKKELYLKGKKEHNYNVVNPNFTGKFAKGYAVDEELYRERKRKDMEEQEENPNKTQNIKNLRILTIKIYRKLREKMPKITLEQWSVGFGVSERTLNKWNSIKYIENEPNEAETEEK